MVRGQIWGDRLLFLHKAGKTEEAISEAEEKIRQIQVPEGKTNSYLHYAYYILAHINSENGNPTEALNHLQMALNYYNFSDRNQEKIERIWVERSSYSPEQAFTMLDELIDVAYAYWDDEGERVEEPKLPLHPFMLRPFRTEPYNWVCQPSEGFFVTIKDDKYGFLDEGGNLVIGLEYDDASSFHEGLAAVCNGDKWAVINKKGTLITDFLFDYIGDYKDGLSSVKMGEHWGLIDSIGNMVIEPQFTEAENFSEGLALVTRDEQFLYIDTAGKVIIRCEPDEFDSVSSFSNDRARCERGGLYGYLDRTGQIIIPIQFENAYDFSEGFAPVFREGKWGFIDGHGKISIDFRFEGARGFCEGLAAAQIQGKWGFIDHDGQFVVEADFDEVGDYEDGLAMVCDRHGYEDNEFSYRGLIDFKGNLWEYLGAKPLDDPRYVYNVRRVK